MTKDYQCTEARFLGDVEGHELTVIRDDGVNRHLQFRNPKGSCYWFDIVTWPGVLTINGDCGTYVFSRTRDMFDFFKRGQKWFGQDDGVTLPINPSYWGEKVLASCRDGIEEFDERRFREIILEYFNDHFKEELEEEASLKAEYSEDCPMPAFIREEMEEKAERRGEIWEAIDSEILSVLDSNDGTRASLAAYEFDEQGFQFQDFFEYSYTRYTFRFIWNLYAIVWAIDLYERSKAPVDQEAPI